MKKISPFVINLTFIIVGSFILALGINIFLVPSKISSGGISSIGTILLHLFGVKLWITNLVINALLFLLGFKYLGRESVMKTVIGIASLTAFLEITSYFPVYNEDLIASTAVGGVLIGIGVGFVIRQGASTGGSDFLAMVIKRLIPHASLAHIILVLDCAVIAISGIVFRSITITIYSIIAMYISSLVTDLIVTLGNRAKAVQIFSDKQNEIADFVMSSFERGATGIHCRGMYSHKEKTMLLCVVSPKELPILIGAIKRIDKGSFVIINDATEVLGEGFRSYAEYDEINISKKKKAP
ncbi:MAG: YitT family protein [Clostridia bacterium]|nr:YitT family protein [Clostridia bacterium]